MTTKTQKTILVIPAIVLAITFGIPNVFAGDYAYQATKVNGGEVTDVRGDFWTYLGRLASASKHIDTIAYMTDATDFTVGVGYYDSTNSGATESYKWLRYWDEGATFNNFHYTESSGPSTESWKAFQVWAVDANTYDFAVGGNSLVSLDCHGGNCDNPVIAGVASWSTATGASNDVTAHFKNLEQKDSGGVWENWDDNSNESKCGYSNADFDRIINNDIDAMIFDVSGSECSTNQNAWLYNGGSGG